MGKTKARLLAACIGLVVVGTTVSGAHSLVWPMLIDGKIEERVATIFTYQNQVSAALAESIVEAESDNMAILDALYAVEEQLNDACAPVQEAGRRHIDGERAERHAADQRLQHDGRLRSEDRGVAYYVRLARGKFTEVLPADVDSPPTDGPGRQARRVIIFCSASSARSAHRLFIRLYAGQWYSRMTGSGS